MRRTLGRTLVILFLTALPAWAGLAQVYFQVGLEATVGGAPAGRTTLEMANGETHQIPVGASDAQVLLNATMLKTGVIMLRYQVRSNSAVQLLTPAEQLVVMGQSPGEFRFQVNGRQVALRTLSLRVAMPGVPILEGPGSPGDPVPMPPYPDGSNPAMLSAPMMPGMPGVAPGQTSAPMDTRLPGLLPQGSLPDAPPGFWMPGQPCPNARP